MSLKYLVVDFAFLVQLAHKTFRKCQKAGEDYVEIACEVRCLHSVLRTLRLELQKFNSKVLAQDSASRSELIATADGCRDVLESLDYVLMKYEGLKLDGQMSASKKIWKRFRVRSKVDELGAIRRKLVTYTSTISILIDTMQIQAMDCVERKVDRAFADTTDRMNGQFERMRKQIYTIAAKKRAEERRGAMISTLSLSTYGGHEKTVWREFKKELVRKGFRTTSLERHKYVLQAYILRLNHSGLLDQTPTSPMRDGTHKGENKSDKGTNNSTSGTEATGGKPVKQNTPGIPDDVDSAPLTLDEQKETPSVNDDPVGLVQHLEVLTSDQESTESSDYDSPSDDEILDSASSSEAALDESSSNENIKAPKVEVPFITFPSRPKEIDSIGVEIPVAPEDTVSEWPDKGEVQKSKYQAHVCEEEAEEELPKWTKGLKLVPDESLPLVAESSIPGKIDFSSETTNLNPSVAPLTPSLVPPKTKWHAPVTQHSVHKHRSKGNRLEISDADLHDPSPSSPVSRRSSWHWKRPESTINHAAIAIGSSSKRSRHKDGERRRILLEATSTLSQWDEIQEMQETRPKRISDFSLYRPRSTPTSPIRPSTLKINQTQPLDSNQSHRRRSRSTPTRSTLPSIHQSKVHYRGSVTEIVDPPLPHPLVSAPFLPRPLKSILKTPTVKFPEDLNPEREGVAIHKDAKIGGVPFDARWTKISRKIVSPEALEAGRERFETRDDHVIVLRVLSKEEIAGYVEDTKEIKGSRFLQ